VVSGSLRQYPPVPSGGGVDRGDDDQEGRDGVAMKATVAIKSNDQEQRSRRGGPPMTWTTPTLVEICIGLEINGYLPAEF